MPKFWFFPFSVYLLSSVLAAYIVPAEAGGCAATVSSHAVGFTPNCNPNAPPGIHQAGQRYCARKTETDPYGRAFCPPDNRWISEAEAYELAAQRRKPLNSSMLLSRKPGHDYEDDDRPAAVSELQRPRRAYRSNDPPTTRQRPQKPLHLPERASLPSLASLPASQSSVSPNEISSPTKSLNEPKMAVSAQFPASSPEGAKIDSVSSPTPSQTPASEATGFQPDVVRVQTTPSASPTPTVQQGLAELNNQVGTLTAQLEELTKVLAEQKALQRGTSTPLAEVDETIDALNLRMTATREILARKDKVLSNYITSIRPSDRALYLTSKKSAEGYPRVPYYIPGTSETGEFWIVPGVNDVGKQIFTLKFADPDSSIDKVQSQTEMSLTDMNEIRRGLLRLREWSKTAHDNKIRRNFEKRVTCSPPDSCPPDGETLDGKSSTELRFLIYEDGSTAGRIQRNKGRYIEGYNFSLESALLLQAYITHVTSEAKFEFDQGTAGKEELDKIFK